MSAVVNLVMSGFFGHKAHSESGRCVAVYVHTDRYRVSQCGVHQINLGTAHKEFSRCVRRASCWWHNHTQRVGGVDVPFAREGRASLDRRPYSTGTVALETQPATPAAHGV